MDNSERIEWVLTRDNELEIKKIYNKAECYAFYEKGFFGNRPLTWNSYEEILASGWKGGVCMRSKKSIERKHVIYNIPLEKVPDEIKKWEDMGFPAKTITFNQSMPDEHLLIQGEFMDWTIYNGQSSILYTKVKKPMNLALAEQTLHAEGLAARLLLKTNLSPSSYEDLQAIIDEGKFERSVIEFSAYDICVGNIPGRNTIIWEVRDY